MTLQSLLEALLLGIVEGLTEFLPVSSTGHLILVGDLLGFQGPPGHVFEVAIQLGAILAVCILYFRRLSEAVTGMFTDPAARRFIIVILLGFLPAVLVGVLARDFIKTVLFSPYVVCISLIVGGLAIFVIERSVGVARYHAVERFPYSLALMIGLAQCVAMIPGVSRSGATILGALMLGVDRKTAAEYSFFLAIPTMFGAVAYDLWKSREFLVAEDMTLIAVGFLAAMFSAMLVVRSLIAFVGRYGFAPFGWYRIAVGLVMLAVLSA